MASTLSWCNSKTPTTRTGLTQSWTCNSQTRIRILNLWIRIAQDSCSNKIWHNNSNSKWAQSQSKSRKINNSLLACYTIKLSILTRCKSWPCLRMTTWSWYPSLTFITGSSLTSTSPETRIEKTVSPWFLIKVQLRTVSIPVNSKVWPMSHQSSLLTQVLVPP